MKRRRDESGFAMLLVFLMAASIAIMMYRELPRAAFEAQRAKEEMLQERGEQYIRAIQLYVAKWKSYPPSIDVLEKTNNVRYLRKRYKDPMTGKDEWRVIHVNSAGQLTDSIIKKKEGEEKKANLNTFIGEMPTVGGATPNAADTGQSVALRRRASDQPGAPGTSGGGGAVPPVDPQSLGNGAQAGQAPGTQYPVPGVAQVPGQPGQPGEPNHGQQQPNQNPYQQQPNPYGQQPPNPYAQQQNSYQQQPPNPNQQQQQPNPYQQQQPPNPYAQQQNQYPQQQSPYQQQNPYRQQQPQNNQTTQPGQPVGNQPGQFQPGQPQAGQPQTGQPQQFNSGMPYPVPTPPGMPAGVSGASTAAGVQPGAANQGLDMINKILTTPRSNMNMGVQGAPGLQIGGGIAGFASKYEAPSIKVYNERQKYNEWEFVYDMKKDKRLLGQAAGMMPNQQQNPLGNGNVPNPLQPNQGNNSSFNQGNSFSQGQGGFNQGQGGSNQGQSGFNQNRGFNQGSQQQQPLPIPGFPQPGRR